MFQGGRSYYTSKTGEKKKQTTQKNQQKNPTNSQTTPQRNPYNKETNKNKQTAQTNQKQKDFFSFTHVILLSSPSHPVPIFCSVLIGHLKKKNKTKYL